MRSSRRALLTALGGSALVGLSGCTTGDSVHKPSGEPPDSSITQAPIPSDPSSFTYEVLGSGTQPIITYYASWKCPSCAQFSAGLLEDIVNDYITPEHGSLLHRGLGYDPAGDPFLGADAPRITRAGLILWNLEPDIFWSYYSLLINDMPSPEDEWGSTDSLVAFAEAAGSSKLDAFRTAIENGAYEDAIHDTAKAAGEDGVGGTPWLVIGDHSFSPLDDPDETLEILDAVLLDS